MRLELLHGVGVVCCLNSVVEITQAEGENVNDGAGRSEDDDETKEV